MLKKLRNQLRILLIIVWMFVITFILTISCWTSWQTQQSSDITYIQRMASLIIYQLEADPSAADTILLNYEHEANIYSLFKDSADNTLFQSDFILFTDSTTLKKSTNESLYEPTYGEDKTTTVSEQGGFQKITDENNRTYYLIPAAIVSKSGRHYSLTLFYERTDFSAFLLQHLPIYLIIWLLAFFAILLLSRILLHRALAPTEKMLQRQKDFIASASHELKTPLAVIMACAENLQTSDLNSTAQQQLQSIDNECVRMSHLLQDLLLLAAIDADKWTIEHSEIDVDGLLIALYEAYEPLCHKQNMPLTLKLSDSPYPQIFTDKERLYQILSIFLDNALQHANSKSSIDVETYQTEKLLSFLIIDHGLGIADKDKPYLFDRFYCADTSHNNKNHFGLGLSIAKELADLLSADIGIKDTPGGGATFFLSLPYKKEKH